MCSLHRECFHISRILGYDSGWYFNLVKFPSIIIQYLKRLRTFAIVSSKKHRDWKKCKFALAVKIDTPMLKNCGGVTMDLVQKVNEAIGGVNNAVCASFLSELEVFDENVGIVAKTNTQQHRCLLFPFLLFLDFEDCC